MKKQVYEIDEKGFITEVLIAEFDELVNPLEDMAEYIILIDPPNGLFRAKWTGKAWVEDMPEEEISEMLKPPLPTEIEKFKQENQLLKAQNNALSERVDFMEDLIAEIAMQVYQ